MAVEDWSTTAGSNTSVGGVNIAENCSPANLNNAIREMMAQIKVYLDALEAGNDAAYQPLSAALTALAALVTAADKLIYATGSNTFATTDLTAAARTLLAKTTTADMLAYIGAAAEPSVSGSGSSGSIELGSGFTFAWKAATFSGGTASQSYGNSTVYTSWAKAWVEGDDGGNDVSVSVTSSGLSSATVRNTGSSCSGTIFSIGV